MRFRPAFPIDVLWLLSGLFLGGCESSDSSASNPKSPKTEADDGFKLNGTLAVGGKAYPAHVSGVYDDSLMSLSVLANLNAMDTGWTLSLVTRPAQGRQPVVANGVSVDATHLSRVSDRGCVYSVASGRADFDAWTPFGAGESAKARMSGSITVKLTRWFLVTEGCPDLTMTLTLADAEATDGKAALGIRD